MPTYLFQYEMLPTTWFYLSSLLIIAVLFKFNRFFSVRNLDILVLLLLTPGLLWIAMDLPKRGFLWLFGVSFFLLVRLFFDNIMVRRPLMAPNLSPSGLTFSCAALLCFVAANVSLNRGDTVDDIRTLRLEQILTLRCHAEGMTDHDRFMAVPGYSPFLLGVAHTNQVVAPSDNLIPELTANLRKPLLEQTEPRNDVRPDEIPRPLEETGVSAAEILPTSEETDVLLSSSSLSSTQTKPSVTAREILALAAIILSHLAVVLGLIYVGHCHFDNIQTGIAAAVLYLLLPYTSQLIGRLDHAVPAAVIVWAVAFYRRPVVSGMFIGLAAGLVFYPVFLLPLWTGFYWKRGFKRFLISSSSVWVAMFLSILLLPTVTFGSYSSQMLRFLGWSNSPELSLGGLWQVFPEFAIYRFPVMALFFVITFGLMLWPAQKNLGTLLSGSAIVLLAVQFWLPFQGGLVMAWFLPLLILTIFRPNLEDRVAFATVTNFSRN